MEPTSPDSLYYLKKISEAADLQKKIAKLTLWLLVPLIVFGVVAIFHVQSVVTDATKEKETPVDWYSVDTARRKGDLKKAIAAADELIAKTPGDFELYYKKGEIQLMLGDKEGAKKSFQAAYDIFPVYKYKSAVDALSTPAKPEPSMAP